MLNVMLRFVLIICFIAVSLGSDEVGETFVTCGSAVKLRHHATDVRLHSHPVGYGSGSGQQSVTGHPDQDENGGYWLVKEAHGATSGCPRGQVIKNGDMIRLETCGNR